MRPRWRRKPLNLIRQADGNSQVCTSIYTAGSAAVQFTVELEGLSAATSRSPRIDRNNNAVPFICRFSFSNNTHVQSRSIYRRGDQKHSWSDESGGRDNCH